MLSIYLPAQSKREYYDESAEEFIFLPDLPELHLELEHSLAALSKWEEIHEKPFLGKDEKTHEEIYSYIRCMIVSPRIPPEGCERRLTREDLEKVDAFINAKMTATWFNEATPSRPPSEVLTAELIMYWMITAGIPLDEGKNYHLQKLFTLIKVFGLKNSKPEKMNRNESARYQAELNRKRREALGSSG